MYSQLKTLKEIQKYMDSNYQAFEDNLKLSSKPFYNAFPYRPSKKFLKELNEGINDIKFETNPTLEV